MQCCFYKFFTIIIFYYNHHNFAIALAGDPPILNPLIVPPNIAIGDNTEIFCSIKRGSPPFHFRWLHNGKEIQPSHLKYRVSSSKTSSHFHIGEIQAEDIGNFTCVVYNESGEDSKTEVVSMEGEGYSF